MFRVIIFAAANLGILLVMGVVFQLIGLDIWLVQSGTGFNTAGVLAFAACFGFGGAFISLALSKFMAKRGMGVQMITTPQNAQERWLRDTVHRQAKKSRDRCTRSRHLSTSATQCFCNGHDPKPIFSGCVNGPSDHNDPR